MRALLAALALSCVITVGCGGNSDARAKMESSNNLKALGLAVHTYIQDKGRPPANMDEVKEVAMDFDSIIQNPITGDNPGYEYVPLDPEEQQQSKVIIFYQLRDGKRDETLQVCYGDGSIDDVGR